MHSEQNHSQPNTAPLTPEEELAYLSNGKPPYSEVPPAQGYTETFEYQVAYPDQMEARQDFVQEETRALHEATLDQGQDASAYAIAEKARQDADVQAARSRVEQAFGDQTATAMLKEATEDVLQRSEVQTDHADDIADAVANNRSALENMKAAAPDAESAGAYAAVKDKLEGRTDAEIDRVARNAREDMKEFGLEHIGKDGVTKDVISAGGSELAQASQHEAIQDTVVAKELVTALADGKPKLSARLREGLSNLRSNPAELRSLAVAVARKRSGDAVSERSFREVGRRFRRSQRGK